MNARKRIAAVAFTLALAPLVGLLVPQIVVHAGAGEKPSDNEVDTQFIFGFTKGADVGELGEKEIESETEGRFGKRDGSYTALESQLRAEFTPTANFRFEIGVPVAYHGIAGVTGLDDRRRQGAFDGLSFEVRYRLLDHEHAPFGLTVGAEPHWARVDETSGEPVANYGSEFSIAADRELVANRVFGALNLLYDPEVTHAQVTGRWERQATLGISAAVTTQVRPGVFFGAEARYLRSYDAIGFDAFGGEALFVGPTIYATLAKNLAVSAAWGTQVAGHAVDVPGLLDLKNFERHQGMLRLMYNF